MYVIFSIRLLKCSHRLYFAKQCCLSLFPWYFILTQNVDIKQWISIFCKYSTNVFANLLYCGLEMLLTPFHFMHVCRSMSVCMYVCMHTCVHVCMYVQLYECMHVCMCACMCACMYVQLYECMHVCIYVCMHVCMYVCIYVCIIT